MTENAATGAPERAPFNHFADIDALVGPIAPDTIVSRTFLKRDGTHMIIFGFAPGQELSEHTSARTAMLYFMRGSARLMLGDTAATAGPGTVVYMEPNLPHSVFAESETVMLLTMVERGEKARG
jgi:quercetin dioxygenase-like cupin family protein